MATEYGTDAVLDFLTHAGERGLIPPGTASALSVGCRTVFAILEENESLDLRSVDLDRVVARFFNRRAKDFNPSSLKEYARRVHRAWALFSSWKADPANFRAATRTTTAKTSRDSKMRNGGVASVESLHAPLSTVQLESAPTTVFPDTFSSSFPVRRGHLVAISNIPHDLTVEEAERLAAFVTLLGVNG
jgi:hypothetical protein